MSFNAPHRPPVATRPNDDAVLVSLELSFSKWVVTSRLPQSEKLSKRSLDAGDSPGLLALLGRLRGQAEDQLGCAAKVIVIQEAGLDGFWIHRLLQSEGVESHVVDAASIAVSRRMRRAKTDRIDGEALLRTLAAFLRGEPRVCSMVKPPSPQEEDRRRLMRERAVLVAERTQHTNRIRGLLASQGISAYNPLHRDRRQRLETLTTGDGRPLPRQLKQQIARALDRIELLLTQLGALDTERAQMIKDAGATATRLMGLKSIGPEFATTLWLEAFYRNFANRRQIAAYGGLAPTPWQSGNIDCEQGISKAGNPRLRKTMIELAWLWLRHQPRSALSHWFMAKAGKEKGRVRRVAIVALARKLLVALWRYVSDGVIPEGAVLKTA